MLGVGPHGGVKIGREMMPDELNAQWTIESAFLRAASPESVYNWIRERAPKESVYEPESLIPDALLKSLHDRQDSLINLALAQFCVSPAMLKQLYQEGDEPLKCAVLSNRFLGRVFWMPSRKYLFTEEEHQAFAGAASPPLLEAYLSNPSLDPEILEALFLRKAPFAEIGEERWKQCILYASANSRLHHDYPHRRFAYSDGWSDYKHGTPMTAAWRLLDTLPATKEWAAVLGLLYAKMLYRGVPREIPEAPREHPEAEHNQEWFWEQMRSFSERSRPVELRFLQEAFQKWKSKEETSEQVWNCFGELRRVSTSLRHRRAEFTVSRHRSEPPG
jgi:hypothetical protein